MNGPMVPLQRARLSERNAAHTALKRLEFDVSHVMIDQTRTLTERSVAYLSVRVLEHAQEMRLACTASVFAWDCKLPIGAVR